MMKPDPPDMWRIAYVVVSAGLAGHLTNIVLRFGSEAPAFIVGRMIKNVLLFLALFI